MRRWDWLGALCVAAHALPLGCASDGGIHDHDNFRDDVITCEEAVAHLLDCCPGFDANSVSCYFEFDQTAGCSPTTTSRNPDFAPATSRCLLARSCDALRAERLCVTALSKPTYLASDCR